MSPYQILKQLNALKDGFNRDFFLFPEWPYCHHLSHSHELAKASDYPKKQPAKIQLQNSAISAKFPTDMKDEFKIKPIRINGRLISKVIVDPHVRKHPDVTDDMILDLIRQLDGSELSPDDVKPPFEYFVSLLFLADKQYRLVWLLEKNEIYIGVITKYRDERKNNGYAI